MRSDSALRLLFILVVTAFLAACASIGHPEGGPRDVTPPVFVRSTPKPGQVNVSGNRVVIEFDENVSLDDAMNKVVVSPPQRTTPSVSANGRRATVELRDSLIPNVTYTIDFADAIKDLNEGNILDGFALDFATGDSIDTLRISGMLFEARTLEPAQGMIVGVYSNLSDTAIKTLPLERITKTNQLGQFTIRGLKPGDYRIYAINDVNRDYHWDRSEDVAFYDVTISPSSTPAEFTDTLVNIAGEDSVVTRAGTRFLPDDILLTWFNEGYSSQYLRSYARTNPNQIDFEFAAKADTLPIIKLINSHRAGEEISQWAVIQANPTLDTLRYWITDTTLIGMDTLMIEARYLMTDTLEQLSMTTDTLRLVDKGARNRRRQLEKEAQQREKEREKERKELEKQGVDLDSLDAADTIPPRPTPISFKITSGSSQDVHRPLVFTSETPVASFDTTTVKLEWLVDSVWYPLPSPVISLIDSLNTLKYIGDYKWSPGEKYRLTVDSAAIYDIYGLTNDPISHEFTVKKLDEYSSLAFNITGLEGRPAVVEVLDGSDKVVAAAPVKGNIGRVEYLSPGTYYARLFIDADTNGVYSTGILDSIQPEEVYYYPKKITLKKNWGIEQPWDIYELPIDLQKPLDVKKNKPKRKRGENDPDDNNEDEEDDEFFDDPFMNAATRNQFGNSSLDYRRR
ncbi:MAG: Ig-like domain-containing protein [Duncaniella sp.]|uniref:Ig-like domain-containing protein n=1 Tax=Duncaniella sp. TaxID=2518496 RepID=UPI0023C0818D|nr:Ig-like domain-containing domain [Duncaniella sp.]MDE6090654.1 Ig-like domain-containing protein [Duncaniella sp.]